MVEEMRDSVVLVTGASGGIGQAVALSLAKAGHRVVLHYRTGRDAALTLAADIRQFGGRAHAVGADLTNEVEVAGLYKEALNEFDRIDHVVANAGMRFDDAAPIHAMSLDQWRATIDGDLTSVFLTCREFFRHLQAVPHETASVVLIGSTAAVYGEAGYADYAAAKAGMSYGLMKSLKNEIINLCQRGRVNCVAPGWTRTPMARAATEDQATMRKVCATIPMNKIATPEDVAGAVAFLVDDSAAGHVSGQIIEVAGGMEGRVLHAP